MSTKPTAVAVINEHLADGATIAEFHGTVTALFKEYSGTSTHGEWRKRAGKMKDEAGAEIEVVFWNRDIPDSWKGQTLILRSVKGDKGTNGVTVFDDTYNNKTTRKLKVTATAEVDFLQDSRPRQQPTSQQTPSQQSARSTSPPPPPSGMSLKMAIAKRATVWNMCFDAAVGTAHCIQGRHGYAMTPAGIAGLATTLFIDSIRGLGLDAVDMGAVNWQDAKGKTLRDHLSVLDRQVMETRTHQAPAAPSPATPTGPQRQGASMADLEDADDIPF